MVTTRMRCSANSRAIGRVIPATPAFEAEYEACPICPSNAATDAVEMITPRSSPTGSVAAMAAPASRITVNVPMRFTRITRSKASIDAGPCLPTTRSGAPIPAQLTTMRSGPSEAAVSTAACTCAGSVTSVARNVNPCWAAITSPSEPGRSAMSTVAPAAASAVAVASPRPDAPPVTRATAPATFIRCAR